MGLVVKGRRKMRKVMRWKWIMILKGKMSKMSLGMKRRMGRKRRRKMKWIVSMMMSRIRSSGMMRRIRMRRRRVRIVRMSRRV
jgi:hypothetical protein